jgi:hypothetical protein
MRTPSSRLSPRTGAAHLASTECLAPLRGLLSGTPDLHPRAYATRLSSPKSTWLKECRPSRGFGDLLWPRVPRVERPGHFSDAPCRGSNSESMPQPTRCRSAVSILNSEKTDLGRFEFLWLNGNSALVQGLKSKVQSRSSLQDSCVVRALKCAECAPRAALLGKRSRRGRKKDPCR